MKKLLRNFKKWWQWYIIHPFKPYYISIVQELVCNMNFINKYGNNWIAGRIEVYSGGPYSDTEIRFFTNKKEFYDWMTKYDFKCYSKKGITKLRKYINENYYHPPNT